MSEKSLKGKELHASGYNCAQSVVSAFDEIESCTDLIKAAASFGGGIGGKRQVCGALSGMCVIAGVLKGYDTPERGEIKAKHTKLISEMCDEFQEHAGSMICGELLGMDGFKTMEKSEKLTCSELVELGIKIAEKYTKD